MMSKLLAAVAFLLPTYLVRFEVAGIPTTLLELLIYATAVVGAVQLSTDPKSWQRLMARRAWLVPALLVLTGAVIGLLVTPDLRTGLGLLKGFIVDPILVYVLLLAFLKDGDDARTVAAGAFWGSVAVATWSLIDAGGLTPSRVIGPYALDADASPNYLAFATAPLLPLTVWLARGRATAWYWLGAAVLFLALIASQSRAGVAVGLGGAALALILSFDAFWRTTLAKTVVITVLITGAAASWLVVRPDFSLSAADGGRVTASNNVRYQLWSATGELMRQHWLLGVGLGNFQPAFTELTAGRVNYPEFIAPKARTPHNLLVGIWAEAGLLGLAGAVSALVVAGSAIFRGLTQPKVRTLAAALAGSWLALLGHGLLDQPIWKNDTMVIWWLLVALPVVLVVAKPVRR